MKKFAAAVISAVILLSGCGNADETYRPEGYADASEISGTRSEPPDRNSAAVSDISSVSAVPHASGHAAQSPPYTDSADGSRELVQTLTSDNGKLTFTLENMFSEGAYYTVTVSAEKTESGFNTVYIDGEAYGCPILTLLKNGEPTDTVKLDIPSGERFVILESAADNFSYGCEIISNIRDFGAAEYPDVLGLIFRSSNTEAAVPEYARYFTVFDGKLTELPIYQNGVKVKPRGLKLEPVSAGLAKQFLTVLKSNGVDYEIIKYEYRFDLENKRLNRQQVRFYGWEY